MKNYDYKSELLEDVFEVETSPLLPIYIVDFKVAAHFINGFYDIAEEVAQGDGQLLRKLIKAMWAYRLNRGPDMLDPFDFVAIVADDEKGDVGEEASVSGKGYWRHIEAHKLEMQEYKAGRAPKQDNFLLVQDIGYEYVKSKKSTFNFFSKEFFEETRAFVSLITAILCFCCHFCFLFLCFLNFLTLSCYVDSIINFTSLKTQYLTLTLVTGILWVHRSLCISI